MQSPIVGAVLTFLGGAGIALLNARLSSKAAEKGAAEFSRLSRLRQIFNIGYIVLVFLLSRVLPWDMMPLLIGAALGLTIPSFYFTWRLIKENEAKRKAAQEKEGSEQ